MEQEIRVSKSSQLGGSKWSKIKVKEGKQEPIVRDVFVKRVTCFNQGQQLYTCQIAGGPAPFY